MPVKYLPFPGKYRLYTDICRQKIQKNMTEAPKSVQSVAGAGPHTGEMLRNYFEQRRTRKSALARLMSRSPDSIAEYQKRPSIQTAILWELCHHLKHNFFADIAAQLPADFSTTVAPDGSKDARIAELELRLKIAEAERDVLLRRG